MTGVEYALARLIVLLDVAPVDLLNNRDSYNAKFPTLRTHNPTKDPEFLPPEPNSKPWASEVNLHVWGQLLANSRPLQAAWAAIVSKYSIEAAEANHASSLRALKANILTSLELSLEFVRCVHQLRKCQVLSDGLRSSAFEITYKTIRKRLGGKLFKQLRPP